MCVRITADALENKGSLINAGCDLTVTAEGAADNAAEARTVNYVLSHVEGSNHRRRWDWAGDGQRRATGIPEHTASMIQAGSVLNVTAGGILQNSGNLMGERVTLSGSAITNGLTDYHTQTPAPTNPNRVINLAELDLGAGIGNAQSALTAANNSSITPVTPVAPNLITGHVSERTSGAHRPAATGAALGRARHPADRR
jgi:filamentous hemagglutinin